MHIDMEAAMPTPRELREQSHLFLKTAEKEPTLVIKRKLASHALALAQLAEKIEREAMRKESIA
jgi:hypothetical protein